MSGEAQCMFVSMPAAMPHVQSGRINALAITGAKRSPLRPAMATLAESGVRGFEINPWFGILGPAGCLRLSCASCTTMWLAVMSSEDMREASREPGRRGDRQHARGICRSHPAGARAVERHRRQARAAQRLKDPMPVLKLPDFDMHYVIDDYTDPWTQPQTILMLHGNAESGAAWYAWVPHLARTLSRRAPRHARLWRIDADGARVQVDAGRADRRLRTAHGCARQSSAFTWSARKSAAPWRAPSPRGSRSA
jgi:hypothetical protein